ncbi:16S rRNA (cytidine1402-2'-O)-methyltransferase [Robiginitalea myxolifaciens]|uniref:Ribosomal RNA small subunit methyltransferase I n=1 Tax=Robiginitalea myxolifaciens TaxID=400055 RepID=A0A1I6G4P7_9FLAO|nr:16S rRNA (cytidine(1402)-2'-O)-methyltransferase [Robiginitalea myxolifaciens]SFR37142.1 16S rRNA (cytidine1402-2'-O)-methyltransferase [Robiginitalea myxolifaciens]
MAASLGELTLVPTPIGNLGDFSPRSREALEKADIILAEDTRTSGKLLKHFEITTPMRSYHMHNEHKVVEGIITALEQGANYALISDAGTPGISDPGFLLVRACVEAGISVQCLPGPVALIPALVLSGFPSDRFVFEGFLPVKKGRQTRLMSLQEETRTMVFYESPHKLIKTLKDFVSVFGASRKVSVSRELSKLYEETIRGSLAEVLEHFEQQAPRGEFVLVLQGGG